MRTWTERCYFEGIPDEVSNSLMKSERVPSYKAIAIAILSNDSSMRSLGFSGPVSSWFYVLKSIRKPRSNQGDLFDGSI